MMNPPKIPQVALFKDDDRVGNLREVDIRWEDCFSTTTLMLLLKTYVMLIKGGFPGNADFSQCYRFLAFLKSKWWG